MGGKEGRIKRYVGIGVILLLVLLCAVFLHDRSRQSIKRFVLRNEEELTAFAVEVLQDGTLDGKKDYMGCSVSRWSGDAGADTVLEFYHHGSGLVPSASYYGFYYAPDDLPKAFQNVQTELLQYESGWKWEGIGDNWGYTEKITDHWYYYEAHF